MINQNNETWISTQKNGIYVYKDNELEHISVKNGLPNNFTKNLICDHQNNIWFSNESEGLIKYEKTSFVNFSNIEGLKNPDNFAVLIDDKQNIWIGSAVNGCYIYNGKTTTILNEKNGLPNNTVTSITKGDSNEIWIATRGGVVLYKEGKTKVFTTKDGLISNTIKCLLFDHQGRLWIGTTLGISVLKNGSITNYNAKDGMLNVNSHTIYEDSKGIIWVGTSRGLHKFYDGNFKVYGYEDGLCNSYVGSIVEDNNGLIWVGTDRCIGKLQNEKFKYYTEADGLNSTIIYLMNKDDKGNLWVGTNKGLDKITLTDEGNITNIEFYGKNEGFYGVECNSRATYKDNEGNLYFNTIKGLFKYESKNNENENFLFPLYISNIKLFLGEIEDKYLKGEKNIFGISDSLILPSKKNHLTFEFKGIDLANPNEVYYSYRLKNFDSTWFSNTKSQYAVYSNIPPGEYQFQVKASSKSGGSNPKIVSCYVKINELPPPFYFSWWFILICTVLFSSIVYNIVTIKNKALRISKEELEQKIKERTKEISKQNREKTVLLQEIHHRVKNNFQIINSLFNIQAYYTTSKETKAIFKESQNRILAMSKVHQSLYESNDFSALNLKDYITKLLNDIKYSYALDKNVKVKMNIDESISIPLDNLIPFALIINEIIANSFKYAFIEQVNNTITIDIQQDDDKTTRIKIADNGVGLPDSFDWENPTSMGIDLIKTLTEQLNGTIEVSSKNGTHYLLTFAT